MCWKSNQNQVEFTASGLNDRQHLKCFIGESKLLDVLCNYLLPVRIGKAYRHAQTCTAINVHNKKTIRKIMYATCMEFFAFIA